VNHFRLGATLRLLAYLPATRLQPDHRAWEADHAIVGIGECLAFLIFLLFGLLNGQFFQSFLSYFQVLYYIRFNFTPLKKIPIYGKIPSLERKKALFLTPRLRSG